MGILTGIKIDKLNLFNFENGPTIRSIISFEEHSDIPGSRKRKSYRHKKEKDEIEGLVTGAALLYFLMLYINFEYNRAAFWQMLGWGTLVIFGLFSLILAWIKFVNASRERKLNKMIDQIQKVELEEELKKFITVYCRKSGGTKNRNMWTYQGCAIPWIQVNGLIRRLASKGLDFDKSRISLVLQYYIREKEYSLMLKSIATSSENS
jgi:hypothetical protein